MDQLGPHQTRIGPAIKGIEQFLQPAGAGLGVVVEQHHVGAASSGNPCAAGLIEAAGKRVTFDTNARSLLQEPVSAAVR